MNAATATPGRTAALPNRLRRSDRERTLVTPEGIAMPVTLASRGSRFGALMLDLTFIAVLMIATTLGLIWIAGGAANLTGTMAKGSPAGKAIEFLIIVWVAAMFLFRNAYFLFFELGPRGATPGKRISRHPHCRPRRRCRRRQADHQKWSMARNLLARHRAVPAAGPARVRCWRWRRHGTRRGACR